jgi:hypothetical protein
MLPVCLCTPLYNFWMPEQVFMKFGLYIMAPEPISNGVLHKSLPSICVSTARSLLGNGLVKSYRGKEYTRNRTVGRVVLYAVRVVPKESRQLVVSRLFFSKNILNTRASATVCSGSHKPDYTSVIISDVSCYVHGVVFKRYGASSSTILRQLPRYHPALWNLRIILFSRARTTQIFCCDAQCMFSNDMIVFCQHCDRVPCS